MIEKKKVIIIAILLLIISCIYALALGDATEISNDEVKVCLGEFEDTSKEKKDVMTQQKIFPLQDAFSMILKSKLISEGYEISAKGGNNCLVNIDGIIEAKTASKSSKRLIDILTFGISYILDTLSGNIERPTFYYYGSLKASTNFYIEKSSYKKEYSKKVKKKNTSEIILLEELCEQIASKIAKDLSELLSGYY